MAYRYGATRGDHTDSAENERQPADLHRDPARERIRDAAIQLYGEHGFHQVKIRQIAAKADVSAPLVIHHYRSAAGLRTACDRYVAQRVYESKSQAVEIGEHFSLETMLRQSHSNRQILRYLTQALMAGGEEIDALMDQLVADALDYTREAVEKGLVKPSRHERRRAVMLLLQGLGAMMLEHQMKRLIGTSPLTDPPEQWGPYLSTVLEIHTYGVLEPHAYQDVIDQLENTDHQECAEHPAERTAHE